MFAFHLSHAWRGHVAALALCGAMASPVLAMDSGADATAAGDDKTIVAVIDRARLVKVPDGTETLVIGNPTIADVTMLHQKNLMVLTPKAFGETNFIALDASGNPVAESTIRVVAGSNALVVQRGLERQSYSCAPRCQPVERLGDDEKYRAMVAAQTQDHFQRLTTSGAR